MAVASSSHKSLAKQSQKTMGAGCLRLFFLPFFLAGAAIFFFLTIRPAYQVLTARSWEKTPCVIASSEVVSHSGSDSSTYSVGIVYHYQFHGRSYTSQRYNFDTGASSGRQSKAAAVERFPAGSETYCYVDPAAPEQAVIDRSFQRQMVFGCFGLIFLLAGGLGMIFAPRLSRQQSGRNAATQTVTATGAPGPLKPQHTPLSKFLGMLAFTIIWNGFISIFLYLVFFSEDAHKAPLFAKIVVGILALVGVASIFGVFTSLLGLFNPRIQITAQATAVPLGGEFQFTWVVLGRTAMLRKLRIVFEGREEATYKRGTSTSTDTQVFVEIPVFESTDRELITRGSARAVIPANLMHTFDCGRNKVLWRLKVYGEIPRWPDVADEYPVIVLPQPVRA